MKPKISRESRKHKKYLTELTETVAMFLTALDIEMKKPSTHDRGKRIAKISNALDMKNSAAMYFGLDYGWKKIGNIKKKLMEKK